jgi:hypothetical protein
MGKMKDEFEHFLQTCIVVRQGIPLLCRSLHGEEHPNICSYGIKI